MHKGYPSPYLDPCHDYNHGCHAYDDCCADPCHDHHHAHECDDQLPVFSSVGRGIKGDSYRVKVVDPDTHEVTQLVGETYDEATKTWHTEWMSENINGGYLEYQYHLRPYNVPATFTITFKYHRPGVHGFNVDGTSTSRKHDTYGARCCDGKPNDAYDENGNKIENNVGLDPDNECSWVWTTPAIPYIWTTQHTDEIVGSGTGTVFTMTMHDLNGRPMNPLLASSWTERLRYPKGWTREQFNAPEVFDPWVCNLKFGWGGDIAVPDFYDISKIIGVSIDNIKNLLNGQPGQIEGSDDVVDYIQDEIERLRSHIHKDLGYGDNGLLGCGSGAMVPDSNNPVTIANYIKAATTEVKAGRDIFVNASHGTNGQNIYTVGTNLRDEMNAMKNELNAAIQDVAGNMPSVEGGVGISVTKKEGTNIYVVENTMAGAQRQLVPQVDYSYKMFNGWNTFVDVKGVMGNKEDQNCGPEVYINLSKNGDTITGGTIQFDFYNQVRLVHPDQMNDYGSPSHPVKFSHGTSLDSYGISAAICGVTFRNSANDNYGDLNNMYIVTQSSTCLWNLSSMSSDESCAWPVFVELRKASDPSRYSGCQFVLYATMIGDGFNRQLGTTCKKWLNNEPCNVPNTSRANTRCAGLFAKSGSTTSKV